MTFNKEKFIYQKCNTHKNLTSNAYPQYTIMAKGKPLFMFDEMEFGILLVIQA